MSRRRRIVRVLLFAAAGIAALALLLVAALAFLVGTQTGTRFLFARLGALMPGTFDVRSTEGRIDSPLTLHGMTYKRPGLEVRIDRLYLEWRLRELLSRRIDVGRLYADGVHVVSTPTPNQQPTQLPNLDLRFNIIVRDARVRGLTVGSAGGVPSAIDEIDLKTTDIRNRVHVDRLAVRSALLRAEVSGTVQPQGAYPVDLTVHWAVRLAGPPAMAEVVGGGTLTGSLETLRADQRLTAPFDLRVAAVLSQPLRDLRFDGRVAFTEVNPRRLRADLPDLPASGVVAARGSLDRFDSWGTVEGAMAPAGRVHLNYRVSRQGDAWVVRQADVTLPGTPARLGLRGRVSLPASAAEAGGGGDLDADLQASWRDLSWPPRGTASFTSPRGEAHVVARARGGPGDGAAGGAGVNNRNGATGAAGGERAAGSLTSEGTLQAVVTSVGPVAASYRLTHQGNDWHLERLELGVPGTPTHLAASGTAAQRGQTFDVDAAMSWRDLRWPLTGPPELKSARGEARVAGSLDSFRAQISAELAAGAAAQAVATTSAAGLGPVPPGRFTLSGSGGRDRFHIDSLTADLLSGRLQGHGDVAWRPRLSWNVALSGQGIDPAAVRPDLPGRLGFDLASRGEGLPAGLTGRVDLPRLQGTLRGQPVAASAALGLAGPSYDLRRFDAHWGSARLQASGRLGERLDLGFDTAAPNLGLLVPGATGGITAKGHLSGPLKTPRVQATVQAQGLRLGTQSVGSASLRADVDLAATGPFEVDADLREVSAAGQLISQVTAQSRGTTANHTLNVTAAGLGDRKDSRFVLGLAGGFSGPLDAAATWRGRITRLDLRSSAVGDWSLQRPAEPEAAAGAVRLRDLCWISAGAGSAGGAGGGRLCASAAWSQAGPWAGEATLAALPLNLMKPFLPADLTISGDINGTAQAHGGSQGIAGADVDLVPGPGDLSFPAEQGRTVTVHFDRGALRAQAGPEGGNATAALALQGIGTLNARLRLPRLTQGIVLRDQPLAGTVAVHLSNLSFLEGFVPDLRRLSGALNADLSLAGTAGAPRVAGQARLDGASAQLPLYGLDLKDVRLTATGNGGSTLAIDAAARSGPGSVQIRGSAGLVPSATTPVHLTVNGSRFAVMDTRDIRILVSPSIDLSYQGTLARVTGEVTVPEAHIRVDKTKKGGPVEPSKDVVFIGGVQPQAQRPAAAPAAVYTRLRLVLPNPAVELDAFGLKGQPSGSLLIVEDPGKDPAGTGELDIAKGGTFQAYGQNLTIERGRLIFGGPLDDPGLDIRASRLSDDQTVTAGIDAKGTLKEPHVSVWSTPAMGQSDALAYLLLGHGLNKASQQEGNRVANAATSLGLSGAGLLAKSIGSRFGLEEASIESKGNLDQASLVLGKYLAPHLYVAYGIGLFQPINTFRVRYIISSKWTLQAESSTGTGADILYTLERGRTR